MKDIDEMVSGSQSRFQKLGAALKGVFSTMFGSNDFSQSPVARTTKELAAQHKTALEMLKVERQRRDISRSARFEANRSHHGENAELTEDGELRRGRNSHMLRQGISGAARALQGGYQLGKSGGSNEGVTAAATQVAAMIAPSLAPLINAIGGIAGNMFKEQAHWREQALQRYQVGGKAGEDVDEGRTSNSVYNMTQARKNYGFDIGGFTSLYTRASRAGAMEGGPGSDKSTMINLMRGESNYGIGSQMTGMLGAVGKAGGGASEQTTAIGAAMGLHMAQGLSRGRMGEVFDQLTAAIEDNAEALTDVAASSDRMLFVSQMGPQFQGNTNASRGMDSAIKGLAGGSTPYTQMTSLAAAGAMGGGASYAEAMLAVQKGVDKEGGVNSEELIKANFGSYIGMYARANKAEKADILFTLHKLTGISMPKLEVIMNRLAKGPMGKVDIAGGNAKFEDAEKTMPAYMMAPRRDKAGGEDNFRIGVKTTGPGDSLRTMSTQNEVALQEVVEESGARDAVRSKNKAAVGSYMKPGGAWGVMRQGEEHMGEDLFFPPGTAVTSPTDGVVTAVNFFSTGKSKKIDPGNGYMVWVKALNGTTWKLYHLDPASVKVRPGSKVKKGDPIGTTLSAKQVAKWKGGVQSHLHVGVEQDGQYVDPMGVEGMDSLASPTVGATQSAPGPNGDYGSSMTRLPAGGGGATGSAASAPGVVHVKVEINDRTSGGVDVQQKTKTFAKQAAQPAPGDAPANNRWDEYIDK